MQTHTRPGSGVMYPAFVDVGLLGPLPRTDSMLWSRLLAARSAVPWPVPSSVRSRRTSRTTWQLSSDLSRRTAGILHD